MKPHLLLLALTSTLLVGCASAATQSSPKLPASEKEDATFDYSLSEHMPPRFLASASGLVVEILYLSDAPEGHARALLRFKGAPHEIAGKVLLVKGTVVNGTYRWSLRFHGKEKKFLWTVRIPNADVHSKQVRLQLPRSGDVAELKYDPLRSQEIDAQEIIALHQELSKDGTLARIAAIDRDFYIKKIGEHVALTNELMETNCGRQLPVVIDFNSVFETKFFEKQRCSGIARKAASICLRDADSKRIFNERVKKIECGYGSRNEIVVTAAGVMQIQLDPSTQYFSGAYDAMKSSLHLTRTVGRSDTGQIIVADPDDSHGEIFIGDGKVMNSQATAAGTRLVWTPSGHILLRKEEGKIVVDCAHGPPVIFHSLSDQRRLEILNSARFDEPIWQREAYALARDDRGTYYYVDKVQQKWGGKNFRVFIGPRGQAKATTLIDIVDDSNGMIFATKSGNLRLMLKSKADSGLRIVDAGWIVGKKRRDLVVLPLRENKLLIYKELGAYDGEDFGTLCE